MTRETLNVVKWLLLPVTLPMLFGVLVLVTVVYWFSTSDSIADCWFRARYE